MNNLERDLLSGFKTELGAFGGMFDAWVSDVELSDPERINRLRADIAKGDHIKVMFALNSGDKPRVLFYQHRTGAELVKLFQVDARTYLTN